MRRIELSLILPCYNEEENVARIPEILIPELLALGCDYEIILIDVMNEYILTLQLLRSKSHSELLLQIERMNYIVADSLCSRRSKPQRMRE